MDKMLIAVTLLLLICLTGFTQATYQGLTPGTSTRADVERTLGQPVNKVSQTLHEYGPKWSARKIFVQYNASAVVERIEVLLADPVSPSDARMYFRFAEAASAPPGGKILNDRETRRAEALSQQPVATRTRKGKLEEYFGEMYYMVLTHEGEAASSRVNQIGYYSRELFDSVTAELQRSETNSWEQRELNTAYTGTNLTYYPEPSVDKCQSDCAANNKCRGFTWIAPGTYNPADGAMCYLVAAVTGRSQAKGHTSAIKSIR